MLRNGIFILATALLSSCYFHQDNNCKILNFKFTPQKEKFEFRALVDTIYEPIVLETTENSIIGVISKIAFHNDTIIIADKQTNSILLFDGKGRFLSKIKRVGRGRQEYLEMSDVYIADDYIFIYDKHLFKVCCYDFTGRYIYSFDTKEGVRIMKHQDRIFVCTNWIGGNCWNNHFIAEFDKSGNIVKTYMKKNRMDNNRISIGDEYFIKTAKGFDFLLLSKNMVYSLSENELYPHYKVDFGEYELPEKIAQKGTDYVVDNHILDKYTMGVKRIIEAGRYRFISAIFDGLYTLVYDMKTEETIAITFFGGNLDGYPFAIEECFEDNGFLIFYQTAHGLHLFNEIDSSKGKLVKKIQTISKSLREEDNGVLIKIKMKGYDTTD